ncbi:MAG: hypothetical protein U5L96_06210 [Owenweeksia sp.]|nr:hypothetical protein [Owenweeksia sp.]
MYFQIPELLVDTEYSEEGSSHSKINTIWIYANNEHQGTFDLPCTTPVILPEGSSDIRLFPGISLNGSSSSRIIYDFYEPLDFKYAHANNGNAVADTFKLSQAQRTTQYTPGSRVIIFENFDDPGLNLEPTSPSDTTILTTGDPNEIFVNPQDSSEINGKAGK